MVIVSLHLDPSVKHMVYNTLDAHLQEHYNRHLLYVINFLLHLLDNFYSYVVWLLSQNIDEHCIYIYMYMYMYVCICLLKSVWFLHFKNSRNYF